MERPQIITHCFCMAFWLKLHISSIFWDCHIRALTYLEWYNLACITFKYIRHPRTVGIIVAQIWSGKTDCSWVSIVALGHFALCIRTVDKAQSHQNGSHVAWDSKETGTLKVLVLVELINRYQWNKCGRAHYCRSGDRFVVNRPEVYEVKPRSCVIKLRSNFSRFCCCRYAPKAQGTLDLNGWTIIWWGGGGEGAWANEAVHFFYSPLYQQCWAYVPW